MNQNQTQMITEVVNNWAKNVIKKAHELNISDERLEEIATQKNWDGRSYGGDYEGFTFLRGGFSEDAWDNILYHFTGVSASKPMQEIVLPVITLRAAMDYDEATKKLIMALVAGIEKVHGISREEFRNKDFANPSSMQFLYKTVLF